MFVNAYACENTFSTIKQVNCKNGMAEETLDDCFRLLANTDIGTDIAKILSETSTTGIPLTDCNKLQLCINFDDALAYLAFLVLNLVNLLFHTSLSW